MSAALMLIGVLLVATGAAPRAGYLLLILGLVLSAALPVLLLLQAGRKRE